MMIKVQARLIQLPPKRSCVKSCANEHTSIYPGASHKGQGFLAFQDSTLFLFVR